MANYKRYKIIEHTADTGLIAYGSNLAEAFANAATGMFSVITDLRKIKLKELRAIEINEENYEYLLFEWLNRLLYHFDTEGTIFRQIDITSFDKKCLVAECRGEIFDANRHEIKNAVKAATFHLLEVDERNNRVQVIFDI